MCSLTTFEMYEINNEVNQATNLFDMKENKLKSMTISNRRNQIDLEHISIFLY